MSASFKFNVLHETEAVPQPFKYVGQYGVMAETNGLYYMRARYYDSATGRFISEDPIGFEGGTVNLYEYVGGNPVNKIDPNGLFPLENYGLCFYNMIQCAYKAIECKKDPKRREKRCGDKENNFDTSADNFNECYLGIPECKLQYEYCGKLALEPH